MPVEVGSNSEVENESFPFVGGFLLALVVSCIGCILYVGTIVCLIVYAVTKRKYPTFSRGLGWGTFAGLFGATLMCTRGQFLFGLLSH